MNHIIEIRMDLLPPPDERDDLDDFPDDEVNYALEY